MDQNQLKKEVEKIAQAIAAQEALRGIVLDAQIDASLTQLRQKQAELQAQVASVVNAVNAVGSGAIAQGDGARAVGERGVLVDGDVAGPIITGSGNTIYTGSASEPVALPPHLARIRDQMIQVFDKSELKTLCFDLGIAADDLSSETRTALAQSLVAYCYQRQRLPELLRLCRTQRPHVTWPQAEQ